MMQPPDMETTMAAFNLQRVSQKTQEGGWGAVIFARHDSSAARILAVKFYRKEMDAGKQLLWQREYSNLVLCSQQPYIVHLASLTLDNRGPHCLMDGGEMVGMVMEYIPSLKIREVSCIPQWKARKCAQCVATLAHGVASLHALGLIHSDLKPDNVLIHGSGEFVKIVDLGLACAAPLGFEWYGTKGY
jgi:serine/threonine protein kinase